MILEGNARGHGAELAYHLLNERDNDHVRLHNLEGFVSDDLRGAFLESEAISLGTQCQKYLFSLSLNPPTEAQVPIEAFEEVIARIEIKLGLKGQPRAVVFHEKLGRRHAHVVWSRIDVATMKAIQLPHFKRKLMAISRELYLEHGWDLPAGFLDHEARDPNRYSREEAGQAKRTKSDSAALKAMFRACWERSDSRAGFAAALLDQGYVLARGSRRGFVAVDRKGKVWSLSRWCGVRPKDLRKRLGLEDQLWSVEEAHALFTPEQSHPGSVSKAKANAEDHKQERAQQRLDILVARQRAERDALLSKLQTEEEAALKAAQSRLPRGMKALWARITGQLSQFHADLASEAQARQRAARAEEQQLIERHLKERRAILRESQSPNLAKDLSEAFAHHGLRDTRQQLIDPPEAFPFTAAELKTNPALILDHVSEKKARFTRGDVLRAMAKALRDPIALKAATDQALRSSQAIPLDDSDDPTFTTRSYRDAEDRLVRGAARLAKRKLATPKVRHIARAIKAQNKSMSDSFGGQLSEEQVQAIHHILAPDGISAVVGLAGAGKSTMLKTAHSAWTRQGIHVHGAALSGKAADGLEDASNIPSRTLASLELAWKNGQEPIAPGEVLVIDEAGMIGTRQMGRITSKIESLGAKLVLVGDPDQLQPIEAGHPFRQLVQSHGAARLTEIHRQRQAWQREASRDLAEGRLRAALERYKAQGDVITEQTRDARLASLVEDYLVDVELNGDAVSRLALAHRRKDVFALNQAIRAGLRTKLSTGSEPTLEVLLETPTGPRAFAKEDRIVFTRNDKDLGVKNGQLGTIAKVKDDKITVRLDSADGPSKHVTFDPKLYRHIDHGYAVTIHKSQGATVDHAYVLASNTMDAPLTYVAMTRHREKLRLYRGSIGLDRPPKPGHSIKRKFISTHIKTIEL